MHDVRTLVLKVEQTPARDGASVVNKVYLQGGVSADGTTQYPPEAYVTFDDGLYAKAAGMVNQQVDARIEIVLKPKARGGGFWTNYKLHDIALAGSLTPQAMPDAGGTAAQPAAVAQPVATPEAAPHAHPLLAGQELRQTIEDRRSVLHATVEFVGELVKSGHIGEAVNAYAALEHTADTFMGWLQTGSWEGNSGDIEKGPVPVEPEQFDPTEVPGVQQGTEGIEPAAEKKELPWAATPA